MTGTVAVIGALEKEVRQIYVSVKTIASSISEA